MRRRNRFAFGVLQALQYKSHLLARHSVLCCDELQFFLGVGQDLRVAAVRERKQQVG